MHVLMTILSSLVLVTALGIDALVCSFGYGVNRIKIPFKSVLVINIICSSLLAFGILFGSSIGSFLPESTAHAISFTILVMLGLTKIFDSALKQLIRRHNGFNKNFNFSFLSLGFILQVFANPEKADIDESKSLTPKEALPLSIALGIDGISVGLGLGLAAVNGLFIVGLSLVSDAAMVMLGAFLGNKVAKRLNFDLSWLSGTILIVIAIINLL